MKPLPLKNPPDTLCLLRLSAIGDVCHAVPVIRTLQKAWPDTKLTWVIGKTEHTLVGDIPDVEFIIFDKQAGWRAVRDLRRRLRGRRFDVLLHMQMSLRASLASLAIPADIRLGFDRKRAGDLQWLFTNAHIPHVSRQHVMDSFLEFPRALGIAEPSLRWDIPIPENARRQAAELAPAGAYVVVSPGSSHAYRNWTPGGYAAVIDHLWSKHRLPVLLTGGPTPTEQTLGTDIVRHCQSKPRNLIGQTNLKTLLTLIHRARFLLSPDSGPAHMGTAVGTPVVSLFAATNPERARPYFSADWVVNRYPDAVRARYGKRANTIPWATRIRDAGTMARIPASEVIKTVDRLLAEIPDETPPPGH